jgi:predicted ATPase
MKIKQLTIQNYKSIKELKIVDPAPFSAFIGANGVGKSNIFEAVEFMNIGLESMTRATLIELFGGLNVVSNKKLEKGSPILFDLAITDKTHFSYEVYFKQEGAGYIVSGPKPEILKEQLNISVVEDSIGEYVSYYELGFSRIFIGQTDKVKLNINTSHQLKLDGSNLEKVLKRLLFNEFIKSEMFEWLSLFIPEFEKLEVHSDNISGRDTLQLTMKGYNEPFGRNLISDGTYNILCLLTAVYQSDKPQFLCIEEPENGLNPYVVRQLVQFFRYQCEEKGHYIWVNTHSQTLVSQLKATEVILVDKKDGLTGVKQLKDNDLHGLPLDEAWLTNALGGGLPW